MKSFFSRRKRELIVTGLCLFLALGLFVWAVVLGSGVGAEVLEKLCFALIVAVGVRWLTIVFDESQPLKEDVYGSSYLELYGALESAHHRIWICQTWFPGTGQISSIILDRKVPDLRILLASFHPKSAIFARIAARPDVNTADAARGAVAASVMEFVRRDQHSHVRFNPIHHPGWIAVIDDYVFWGATPVSRDNWSVPHVFHRAHRSDAKAQYWEGEFKLLWEGKDEAGKTWSHSYEAECQYNKKLKRCASHAAPASTRAGASDEIRVTG
jgi:hypothetical protein